MMGLHPNIALDTLVMLVGGDKGDILTKLIMQCLNSKNGQSVKLARALAMFDGDRDNRECIEKVHLFL